MAEEEILFTGFNQDLSCMSLGTSRGFRIYQTEPMTLLLCRDLHGGVGIVELLYTEHIMALVVGGSNPKWQKSSIFFHFSLLP